MKSKIAAIIVCVVMVTVLISMGYFVGEEIQTNQIDNSGQKIEEPIMEQKLKLNVVSFNIRMARLWYDSIKEPDNWNVRKDAMVAEIKELDPDLLGMQEVVTAVQDVYLTDNLEGYSIVGTPRDGEDAFLSEGMYILYKTEKFELLDSGTFWLSDTPDVVSNTWGASCMRTCTYAILKDKTTKKTVAYFNTHLDVGSAYARRMGMALILDRIKEAGYPTILTGDFNCSESSKEYADCTAVLADTKYEAKSTMSGGTYHGYSDKSLAKSSPIDFCMVSKGDFDVAKYEIINRKFNGVFTSDHYAIRAQLSL